MLVSTLDRLENPREQLAELNSTPELSPIGYEIVRKAKGGNFRALSALMALPVLVLGAIEGWYTRTNYAADAISYLDISRAIPKGDWKCVFNALWSSGYPTLIALVRSLFPRSPQGEWLAVHVLNLLILLFTYFAFLYLLRSFRPYLAESSTPGALRAKESFLFFAGICIFLCAELCINGPSRVGPDPLVDGLFFAAMGTAMRLIRRPGKALAAVLGVILGAGYLVKAIFLPVSGIILLVTACALRPKRKAVLPLLSGCIFAVFALPYIAGISRVLGRFTIGEAGPLNYAFMVNLLPYYTNWQGGPAGYGIPIHPTHVLMANPPLFEFSEPFHNTYAAYGNIAYWYQGYQHFWSMKYQTLALARNSFYLAQIVLHQPMTYALAGLLLVLWLAIRNKEEWRRRSLACWPLYAPPLLAILLYLCVYVEGRYLASFLATLGLAPFLSLCLSQERLSRRMYAGTVIVLALAAAISFATVDRVAFSRAIHHQSYTQDREWKLAGYLVHSGLHSGDKVGVIGGPNLHCTWAYVAGVRIVAEMGGVPYDPHPVAGRERWWGHHAEVPDTSAAAFWELPPETQAKILQVFRNTGAVAVIAPAKSPQGVVPGWDHVPGSPMWVHRL